MLLDRMYAAYSAERGSWLSTEYMSSLLRPLSHSVVLLSRIVLEEAASVTLAKWITKLIPKQCQIKLPPSPAQSLSDVTETTTPLWSPREGDQMEGVNAVASVLQVGKRVPENRGLPPVRRLPPLRRGAISGLIRKGPMTQSHELLSTPISQKQRNWNWRPDMSTRASS